MKRTIYDAEHEAFRDTVKEYIERELVPNHEKWEAERIVDRSAYTAAGKYGLIGFNMPEEYGGGGSDDFRFNAIIDEEIAKAGVHGPALSLHNDVVGPYFKDLTNDEQKQRWLPGIASGETIIAVAMTEPRAGSDLAGIGPPRSVTATTGSSTARRRSSPRASTPTWWSSWPAPTPRPGTRASRCWSSSATWRASAAAASSTRWACTARTPRSCTSRTSACPTPTCSARKVAASIT